MRRRSKYCHEISLFADEDKVERVRLAYCLRWNLRARRRNPNKIIDLDRGSKQEQAFYKLADKLDKLNIDDVEGYIGSAFTLFDPIYPNMLLSSAVEKHYFSTIDGRLQNLTRSFFSCYTSVIVRRQQVEQSTCGTITCSILHRAARDINPLFLSWYCYTQNLTDIPNELTQRARVTFYLWPLGYYQSAPWRVVLRDLQLVSE